MRSGIIFTRVTSLSCRSFPLGYTFPTILFPLSSLRGHQGLCTLISAHSGYRNEDRIQPQLSHPTAIPGCSLYLQAAMTLAHIIIGASVSEPTLVCAMRVLSVSRSRQRSTSCRSRATACPAGWPSRATGYARLLDPVRASTVKSIDNRVDRQS